MSVPRPWTWRALVISTLAKGLLACVLCLGLWGAGPALLGWRTTTVMTGSMLPRLAVGDLAVSRPLGPAGPTVGTVLLYDDPDHPGRLRLHRFVDTTPDGRLITKGDANPDRDSSPVEPAAVHGMGTLRVPVVGLPIVWLRTGDWLPLGLTVVGLAGLVAVVAASTRYGYPDDPDGSSPGGSGGGDRAHAVLARVALPLALTGLLVGTATPAGAVFTSRTSAPASSFTANDYFKCATAVAAATPWVWYRMDETSATTTTATDSSGNARTGRYGGTKTALATRACSRDTGYAMTFNGSTGYLSSPLYGSAPPNTFTVEIWFKTTTTRGGKLIGWGNAQTGASVSYDRHLYLTNDGTVIFGVYPGAVRTVRSDPGLNDGKWHHAVGTLSSAGQQLYLDGTLVDDDPGTTTAEQATISGYWRIAYDNLDSWVDTPTSRFFAGTLDDAAVYLTALSAAQVKAHYEAGTS